jgi:outer membrane lipoprotein SlyB
MGFLPCFWYAVLYNISKVLKMKKTTILFLFSILSSIILSGCAGDSYNSGYSYESQNDKKIDKVISEEMNSLSDKDIAQLNKLK